MTTLEERIRARIHLMGTYHRYTEMAQRRRPMPGHMNTTEAIKRAQQAWDDAEMCSLSPDDYGHHWVAVYRKGVGEMCCIHCGVPQAVDVTKAASYQ